MSKPIHNPFFRPDYAATDKGRCISDAEEVARARRKASNRAPSYGKICPGCDKRYGTLARGGFIDIERCSKCPKPKAFQRR